MMTIDELKERKRQLGFTNEQIARLSGVPLSTVQKVFGGTTASPRRNTLEILSDALEENAYADTHRRDMVKESSFRYGVGAEAKKQGEYTVKDVEALPDDRLVELIDGEIYDMCYPSLIHQDILLQMAMQLHKCMEDNCRDTCKVYISPSGVRPDNDEYTRVIPDLFVSCDMDKCHGKDYGGAPDFIVEILSKSSVVRDRIIKQNKYWHSGCREYWIIDPENKEIEVNYFEGEKLGMKYTFDDMIPVNISDGKCEVDFAAINTAVNW